MKPTNKLTRRIADRLRGETPQRCFYAVQDERGMLHYQNGIEPRHDEPVKVFVGFNPAQWDNEHDAEN